MQAIGAKSPRLSFRFQLLVSVMSLSHPMTVKKAHSVNHTGISKALPVPMLCWLDSLLVSVAVTECHRQDNV